MRPELSGAMMGAIVTKVSENIFRNSGRCRTFLAPQHPTPPGRTREGGGGGQDAHLNRKTESNTASGTILLPVASDKMRGGDWGNEWTSKHDLNSTLILSSSSMN